MQREILQEETGNYLRVVGEKEETYSDRIFYYQEIPGFLPLEIRHINGQKEYLYDISGRVSLEEYWARESFGVKETAGILLQIMDMAAVLEEYLLDGRGVVLCPEFLFLHRGTGEVSGIYQEGRREGIVSCVGRLSEHIMDKMDQSDKELVFFIYRIHKMTKEDGCTRNSLREYLLENIESVRLQSQREEPEQSQMDMPIREGHEKENGPAGKRSPGDARTGTTVRADEISPEKKEKGGGYLLSVLFLTACLAAMGILWQRGVFQKPLSGETDYMKLGASCIFVSCVAGYGIWKTLPFKNTKGGRESDYRETLYDERQDGHSVCLIPESGCSTPIPVSDIPFRLASLKIDQEAGVVSVTDEESDRGVFLNGKKLVPWHKNTLQDGDVLQFSGKSYVVEIAEWMPPV